MNKIIGFIVVLSSTILAQFITINQFTENWQNDSVKVKYYEEMNCNDKNKDCEGYVNKYDSVGRLVEKIEYDEDKVDERTFYKYNKFGKLELMEKYDEDNKLDDKEIYLYDSIGRIIEFRDLDSKGKVDRLVKYKYFQNDTMRCIQYDKHNVVQYDKICTKKDKYGKYLNIVQTDYDGNIKKTRRKIEYLENLREPNKAINH